MYWISNLTNLIWLRNHVVAPLSEEFTFRACMLPLLLQCFRPLTAVFVCPLFFGVGKTLVLSFTNIILKSSIFTEENNIKMNYWFWAFMVDHCWCRFSSWVLALCGCGQWYQCFRGTFCPYLHPTHFNFKEAVCTTKMLAKLPTPTWCKDLRGESPLIWMLKKQDGKVWTGFFCLRLGTSTKPMWT